MRFRFLAVTGPASVLQEIQPKDFQVGHQLGEIVQGQCFRLWADPQTPTLVGGNGEDVLIGLLISRERSLSQAALPSPLPEEAEFLRRYWGAYLLFRGEGAERRVLRDPSGAIPLYVRADGTLTWYSSDAQTLLHGSRPVLDRHFLRHWLSFPYLRTSRTGLAGVQELLPGMRHSSAGGIEPLWSPWDHVSAPSLSFEEAAARVRNTALATIPKLVPDGARLVVQLSGGLDSSIVAAALANAGKPFQPVTFATLSPDGDERRYARMLTDHLGAGLVEILETEAPVDFSDAAFLSPRPLENALRRRFEHVLASHFSELGAELVMGGAGGDNVFAYSSTAAPAVDALRCAGPGAALAALSEVSILHNCTLWRAARSALKKASGARRAAWPRDTSFLASSGILDEPDPHPWLPPPSGTLPGKADHVLSILGMHHFLRQDASGTATLHPLLAQPLLELCLSIPSWLWLRGGRDRAVARAAFRGLLPAEILDRRTKGRLQSLFVKGYMQGRRQIETLLVGGMLGSLGLIDEAEARDYLRQPGEPNDRRYRRLLDMAAAETWLRSFPR